MVPSFARPVVAHQYMPSLQTFPSLASSNRRLVFISIRNVFIGIYILLYVCLDRVTDEFFFAYLVLTKPEYAFIHDRMPDSRKITATPCPRGVGLRLPWHRLPRRLLRRVPVTLYENHVL